MPKAGQKQDKRYQMQSKTCTKCLIELPIDSFRWVKSSAYKAGGKWRSQCKKCEIDLSPEKRSIKQAKERERVRAMYATDSPKKEKAVKRCRAYQAKKKEQRIAENIGAHSVIHWHKCAKCNRLKLFKRKEYEKDKCGRCLPKTVLGWTMRPKQISCIKCGELCISKVKGAMCGKCKRINYAESRRKARKQMRSTGRVDNRTHAKRAKAYGVKVESFSRYAIYDRDNHTCYLCGITVRRTKSFAWDQATIDHVIPLSKGGPHTPSNVRTCCMRCNVDKGDKAPSEHHRRQGATQASTGGLRSL